MRKSWHRANRLHRSGFDNSGMLLSFAGESVEHLGMLLRCLVQCTNMPCVPLCTCSLHVCHHRGREAAFGGDAGALFELAKKAKATSALDCAPNVPQQKVLHTSSSGLVELAHVFFVSCMPFFQRS